MKKRLIGAVIVVGVLLIGLLLGNITFSVIVGILAIIGLREIININFNRKDINIIKLMSYINMIIILITNIYKLNNNMYIYILPILSLTIPIIIYNNKKKYNINDAFYLIGSIILLSLAFSNIIYLRNDSIYKCIYVFIIAFMTDTYAYIGGMLIGKHKFTSISPKKTIEGCITGIVSGTFIGSMFYYILVGDISFIKILIISFILTILSEIGDLFFSSIKRYYDKKDYSNLIPGHGGILDRFDSVIFVSLGIALLFSMF